MRLRIRYQNNRQVTRHKLRCQNIKQIQDLFPECVCVCLLVSHVPRSEKMLKFGMDRTLRRLVRMQPSSDSIDCLGITDNPDDVHGRVEKEHGSHLPQQFLPLYSVAHQIRISKTCASRIQPDGPCLRNSRRSHRNISGK